MRAALIALAVVLLGGGLREGRAHAQSPTWVVIAAHVEHRGERATDGTTLVVRALQDARWRVLAGSDLAALVDRDVSAPYREPPREWVAQLGPLSERVLEQVATGQNVEALAASTTALREAEPFAAAIGRDGRTTRTLGDLCLYAVRAHLAVRDTEAARARVRECLRLVPDLAADVQTHPPGVRTLLDEARRGLTEGEGASLVVQAGPGDPAACTVRVQGRPVGQTPTVRLDVVPGETTVQVECAPAHARLHRVRAARGAPTVVEVAARLDAALVTEGDSVRLVYRSPDELRAALADAVTALGQALRVEHVLVVTDDGHALGLARYRMRSVGRAELVARAPLPATRSEAVRSVVDELVEGRSSSTSTDDDVPGGASSATAPRVIGWVLAGLGAVSLGASWAFWVDLQAKEDSFAIASSTLPGYIDRQSAVDDAVPPVLVAGGIGAGLATIGVPLLLPSEDGTPWWAWVLGAGGLVPAGISVYVLATEGDCIDSGCTRREQTAALGSLLLMHAAPFLAVPITYLLRDALGGGDDDSADSRVMLRVARDGASLLLRGAF